MHRGVKMMDFEEQFGTIMKHVSSVNLSDLLGGRRHPKE